MESTPTPCRPLHTLSGSAPSIQNANPAASRTATRAVELAKMYAVNGRPERFAIQSFLITRTRVLGLQQSNSLSFLFWCCCYQGCYGIPALLSRASGISLTPVAIVVAPHKYAVQSRRRSPTSPTGTTSPVSGWVPVRAVAGTAFGPPSPASPRMPRIPSRCRTSLLLGGC